MVWNAIHPDAHSPTRYVRSAGKPPLRGAGAREASTLLEPVQTDQGSQLMRVRSPCGSAVQVQSPRGGGWHSYSAALLAIAQVDRDAARLYLNQSLDELRRAVQEPQSHDLKGIDRFIEIADGLDARILDAFLADLDPSATTESWIERNKDSDSALVPLRTRAEGVGGEVGRLALSLRHGTADAER